MIPKVKIWRDERGNAVAASTVARNDMGGTALHLIGAIIASDAIKSVQKEGRDEIDPSRVAILACDIAEAFYAEMDMRGWLTEFDPKPKRIEE